MLFESINAISNAKDLEDKYAFQISEQTKLIDDLKNDKDKLMQDLAKLTSNLDQTNRDLEELSKAKTKQEIAFKA